MSIAEEILRLQNDRNTLRNWTVQAGLTDSTADLDKIAEVVSDIEIKGGVNVEVQEGQSYTIEKGYHDGSGVVKGVAGGGNYNLQSKNVTPTKQQQSVTSDDGYYGLSSVVVAPIPDNYQDISSVTATAGDVLANKVIVDATGRTIAGTMTNNGDVSGQFDGLNTLFYSVPAGYTTGGKVSLTNDIEQALAAI